MFYRCVCELLLLDSFLFLPLAPGPFLLEASLLTVTADKPSFIRRNELPCLVELMAASVRALQQMFLCFVSSALHSLLLNGPAVNV